MSDPRLVVFFARVGDLVMLTPLLQHLSAHGGVELLARPWAAGLLGGQTWLGAVHGLAKPNAPVWQDWLFGSPRRLLGTTLAARRFSEILVFGGEKPGVRRWIEGWRGSTPVRVLPFTGAAGDSPHMVDVYRRAAEAIGLDGPGFPLVPHLEIPAERLQAARQRLAPIGRRVVAVQAGSSLTHRWFRRRPNLKGLSADQWGRWLGRLIATDQIDGAVLLGTLPERREALAIRAQVPEALRGRVHDWTGVVSLADLPAVVTACLATLSVDTGPGHIAAATGAPLLSIFGPTNPQVFAPRGPGPIEILTGSASCQFCHQTPAWKSCRVNRCLTSLADEHLDQAWYKLMGNSHVH